MKTSLQNSGPPTGGLRKAMYVLDMHWFKDRTKDSTRVRHIKNLRVECAAYLERTKEYN